MNGLTVCGGLLPAVGMAMLMKMLWDNKICMFYFLGFVLAAYLNLPLIALAVTWRDHCHINWYERLPAESAGSHSRRLAGSFTGRCDTYELDEEEEEFFS